MAIEFEIFQHEPDATESPTVRWMQAADALTVSPFREFIAWPDEDPQRAYTFRYSFTERNPLLAAKDFFSRHGGSAKAFLLPSWERDWTPAEIPAAGATEIEVEGSDWLDSYPIHHPDGPGRYAYIFDTENGFHAFRITAAAPAAPSTTLLTIEQALPFTPAADALYGWLHVARFAGDDAEWMHHAPQAATVEFGFITTRQRIVKDENGNADGLTIYASQPMNEVNAEQAEPPLSRFDICETLGPVNFRVSQFATFATEWSAWIATDGVRLGKYAAGTITPPTTGYGFLSDMFSSAPDTKHISLAFDQTGYEVIAWQHDTTTAKVRKKTSGVVTTYEFTGNDPVLFYNGTVAVDARLDGSSDVVCYYRKPGESIIFARYQRDAFGVEYKAAGVPFLPIALLKATFDDIARTFTVFYIDNGWRVCQTPCDAYPPPPTIPPDPYVTLELDRDAVGVAAELPNFEDEYAIIEPPTISEEAAAAASLSDFESENIAPPPTDFSEAPGGAASLSDIAYEVIISASATPQESAAALASIQDMTYSLVAIENAPTLEAAGSSPSITDIYFGP